MLNNHAKTSNNAVMRTTRIDKALIVNPNLEIIETINK